MEDMKLILKVKNSEDVLIRITSVFHSRGFKIRSLNYCEELESAKMYITAYGQEGRQEQMISQLAKLHDIMEAQRAY